MTERRPCIAGSLALAAVLAAAGSAEAGPFQVLRSGADARVVIDPATVERVPGASIRKTSTVTVQRNIATSPPPQPGYVRSVSEYDCAAQTMRWRSFSAFSRSGDLLGTRKNPSTAWEPATQANGRLGEWRVVCGYSSGDSVMVADSVAKLVVALMAAFDTAPPPAPPATTAAKTAPGKAPGKS